MISYETYKILHLFTLLITVSALGGIFAEAKWITKKSFKITIGFLSFLIFVAGMGLIARLGFKHGEGFPLWVYVKITMWIVFNISLVTLFKVKQPKAKIFCGLVSFFAVLIAVFTAVTKLV